MRCWRFSFGTAAGVGLTRCYPVSRGTRCFPVHRGGDYCCCGAMIGTLFFGNSSVFVVAVHSALVFVSGDWGPPDQDASFRGCDMTTDSWSLCIDNGVEAADEHQATRTRGIEERRGGGESYGRGRGSARPSIKNACALSSPGAGGS